MTEFIDALRAFKLTELKKAKRFVFVNSKGEPFAQSAWTAFVKRSWSNFTRPQSEGAVVDGQEPARQPNPSLCRTIFVTNLNSTIQ
jgi:hypothetical protein